MHASANGEAFHPRRFAEDNTLCTLSDYFRASEDDISRARFLSLALVYDSGGVYRSRDLECFKPIDPIIDGHDAVVCAMGDWAGPCFFGATPKHPWIKDIVDTLHEGWGTPGRPIDGWSLIKHVTKVTARHPEVKRIGDQYIVSLDPNGKPLKPLDDAYAVHTRIPNDDAGYDPSLC